MLILCTGLGCPPFSQTGGFGVDKHVNNTDIALEAETTVPPQVQERSDFASISPSRGVFDLPWKGQGLSLSCLPVIYCLSHQKAFSHALLTLPWCSLSP